jgi:hypothetical protein
MAKALVQHVQNIVKATIEAAYGVRFRIVRKPVLNVSKEALALSYR